MIISSWNSVSQMNTTIDIWIQNKFEVSTIDANAPFLTYFIRIDDTDDGLGIMINC